VLRRRAREITRHRDDAQPRRRHRRPRRRRRRRRRGLNSRGVSAPRCAAAVLVGTNRMYESAPRSVQPFSLLLSLSPFILSYSLSCALSLSLSLFR